MLRVACSHAATLERRILTESRSEYCSQDGTIAGPQRNTRSQHIRAQEWRGSIRLGHFLCSVIDHLFSKLNN
jgi:hypothetical protein